MKHTELLAALLDVLRSHISKWDVADHALDSTKRTVRFIAIIVAIALSPVAWVLLAEFLSRR